MNNRYTWQPIKYKVASDFQSTIKCRDTQLQFGIYVECKWTRVPGEQFRFYSW